MKPPKQNIQHLRGTSLGSLPIGPAHFCRVRTSGGLFQINGKHTRWLLQHGKGDVKSCQKRAKLPLIWVDPRRRRGLKHLGGPCYQLR